jgi:hypothetical protein
MRHINKQDFLGRTKHLFSFIMKGLHRNQNYGGGDSRQTARRYNKPPHYNTGCIEKVKFKGGTIHLFLLVYLLPLEARRLKSIRTLLHQDLTVILMTVRVPVLILKG